MPAIHTETFRVRYYECDAYGHLNNTNYLRWMQEAFHTLKSVLALQMMVMACRILNSFH